MKKQIHKRKGLTSGITLVALVITIIVLLILAGITISLTLGQEGIIKMAKLAGKNYIDAAEYEQIQLGELSNTLEDLLVGKGITSKDIAKASKEELQGIYGATVKGYELPSTTVTDVGWKIFYADENNIYLIADNYVERANLPSSTIEEGKVTSNKPNDGGSNYQRTAYFSNILEDYRTGSARITDHKRKALNYSYFNENHFTSTNNNMKAVAYMMDVVAWNSKFKDVTGKAEYVIGGPPIEMIMKSYSQKYGVTYQARAKDETGYEISTNGETWKNYMDTTTEYLNKEDSLYVINTQRDAYGMWISSPSATTYHVMIVNDSGYVGNYNVSDTNFGFRPLVCLTSDVRLQKNADGTYTIL